MQIQTVERFVNLLDPEANGLEVHWKTNVFWT